MTADKHQINKIARLSFEKHWEISISQCNFALQKHILIAAFLCCSCVSCLAIDCSCTGLLLVTFFRWWLGRFQMQLNPQPEMLCSEYILFSLALRLENSLFVLWTCKSIVFNNGGLIKVPAYGCEVWPDNL